MSDEKSTFHKQLERNPTSRKWAIFAKCWDCMGGKSDPGIRERIRSCSVRNCTLREFRPYQTDDEESAE